MPSLGHYRSVMAKTAETLKSPLNSQLPTRKKQNRFLVFTAVLLLFALSASSCRNSDENTETVEPSAAVGLTPTALAATPSRTTNATPTAIASTENPNTEDADPVDSTDAEVEKTTTATPEVASTPTAADSNTAIHTNAQFAPAGYRLVVNDDRRFFAYFPPEWSDVDTARSARPVDLASSQITVSPDRVRFEAGVSDTEDAVAGITIGRVDGVTVKDLESIRTRLSGFVSSKCTPAPTERVNLGVFFGIGQSFIGCDIASTEQRLILLTDDLNDGVYYIFAQLPPGDSDRILASVLNTFGRLDINPRTGTAPAVTPVTVSPNFKGQGTSATAKVIRESKTVRIAVRSFEHLEAADSLKAVGQFERLLGREISLRLFGDVNVKFIELPSDSTGNTVSDPLFDIHNGSLRRLDADGLFALEKEGAHIVIAGMVDPRFDAEATTSSDQSEVASKVYFTTPYMAEAVVIGVEHGGPDTPEALAGFQVSTPVGVLEEIDQAKSRLLGSEVVYVNFASPSDLSSQFETNSVEAAVSLWPSSVFDHNELRTIWGAPTTPWSIAVSKQDRAFVDELNKVLETVIEDGTWQRLMREATYSDAPYTPQEFTEHVAELTAEKN